MLTKAEIDKMIVYEPETVLLGLLKARRTGVLSIRSALFGDVRLGVVTLRKDGGKAEIIPIIPETNRVET